MLRVFLFFSVILLISCDKGIDRFYSNVEIRVESKSDGEFFLQVSSSSTPYQSVSAISKGLTHKFDFRFESGDKIVLNCANFDNVPFEVVLTSENEVLEGYRSRVTSSGHLSFESVDAIYTFK